MSFRYPSSGPVFARAVDLLALTDALPANLRKALVRLADESNPEGVGAEKRGELVARSCAALVGREDPALTAAVTAYLAEWDLLAAALNDGTVAPENPGLAAYPLIRFVGFDVALRLAAAAMLETLRPQTGTLVTAPVVEFRWLHRDALRRTMDQFRTRPLEQIASDAKLSLQTVQRWRSGDDAPRPENLLELAASLAEDRKGTMDEIVRELRFGRTTQMVLPALDSLVGPSAIDDLVNGVRTIANRTLQTLLVDQCLSAEALRRLLLGGARSVEGREVVVAVSSVVTHPGVRDDLRALTGSWVERLRIWLQKLGTDRELLASIRSERELANNAEFYLRTNRELLMHIADPFAPRKPFHVPEPAHDAVEALRASPSFQANALSDAGLVAFARGELRKGIELLREAVMLEPENGKRHYAFGAKLGVLAGFEEQALWHLARAAELMPGSPEPITEIGIVLTNRDRCHEAEEVFASAEAVASAWVTYQAARGSNAIQLRDFVLAERWLRAALASDERRDHAGACLLYVLEKTGRGDEAEARELRRLLIKRHGDRWRRWVPSPENGRSPATGQKN